MLESFEEYVAAELAGLMRYATVLVGDPHLAQDIVQEVLIRARPRWSDLRRPQTYLRKMIVNEHASWRRLRRNQDCVSVSDQSIDDRTAPVDDPSIAYVERDAMMQRLNRLPRKQRAALVLRYYEDRTDEEIAEILDCRPATVRSQIARALAALRTADSTEATDTGAFTWRAAL